LVVWLLYAEGTDEVYIYGTIIPEPATLSVLTLGTVALIRRRAGQ
jgi:hypothetical protein